MLTDYTDALNNICLTDNSDITQRTHLILLIVYLINLIQMPANIMRY